LAALKNLIEEDSSLKNVDNILLNFLKLNAVSIYIRFL